MQFYCLCERRNNGNQWERKLISSIPWDCSPHLVKRISSRRRTNERNFRHGSQESALAREETNFKMMKRRRRKKKLTWELLKQAFIDNFIIDCAQHSFSVKRYVLSDDRERDEKAKTTWNCRRDKKKQVKDISSHHSVRVQ